MLDTTFPAGSSFLDTGLVSALAAIQERNLDALARAQKAAAAGFAALSRAQGDVLQEMLREASALATTLQHMDLHAAVAAPFDLASNAVRNFTARSNRLAELATVAVADPATILQDRLLAALEETKHVMLGAIPAIE